eukprot:478052-Amphidinium_carterae.1
MMPGSSSISRLGFFNSSPQRRVPSIDDPISPSPKKSTTNDATCQASAAVSCLRFDPKEEREGEPPPRILSVCSCAA